jgi:uncharacterized DUF497 family protein
MTFTYDLKKYVRTRAERGIDFKDAEIVFAGVTLTKLDTRRDYGEDRFQTIGFLAGRMVMIVWTPRGEARHIISMRKCNGREKAIYQQQFAKD